ncbi:MAG: IS630 family transposase, partial [Methylococcales bacterium]|nr:IS630 family transposase [Methylococcales bacterium]
MIPPDDNCEFVAHMEEILELYQRPHNIDEPIVCMDETSKQLTLETRIPIPASPRHLERVDYEYKRNGTANIFMFTEPLRGWRWASVTERRTRIDWAHAVKHLLDKEYPNATVVHLVMDNLNTHTIGSLYAAFPPEEARRLADRLELHYTPKHGSWLNIAEIELGVLSRQCLKRRIGTTDFLTTEVLKWEEA